MIGGSAIFTCDAMMTLTWYFNEKSLPSNAKVLTNNSVLIDNVKENNKGNYECVGASNNGTIFGAIGELHIYCKQHYF